MEAITPERMREIDRYTIEEIGIPSLVLMENAARSVFEEIDLDLNYRFLIVSSCGNNGADGLVVARHLLNNGKEVDIAVVGNTSGATAEFLTNFEILTNMRANIMFFEETDINALDAYDVIVDALFGTGLSRDVAGVYRTAVEWINSQKDRSYIISVDIPSGLDGSTGEVRGTCVIADMTVTFHRIKTGMVDRLSQTGVVVVKNIGAVENEA